MARRRKIKYVLQKHHIKYEPEITVVVTKGEHKILSLMQWYCRKKVSKGFIQALKYFIRENEARARDFTADYERSKRTKTCGRRHRN